MQLKTYKEYYKENKPIDLNADDLQTLYHCYYIGLDDDQAIQKLTYFRRLEVYESIIIHTKQLINVKKQGITMFYDISEIELKEILHLYQNKLREYCLNEINEFCKES